MSRFDDVVVTAEQAAAMAREPEYLVAAREAALCARQLTNLWAAEYPGPAGDELWTMIGLPPDEAAAVECDPVTPVADHYWRYRRELEGAGETEALGIVHQHIDGLYVYLASGLTDLSGFRDASGWKIDREGRHHSAERLTWLTLAGLHCYAMGPSARANVEAGARGQVMSRLHEIATAMRTSEFRAPSNAPFAADSTVHACLLDLLAGSTTDPKYFTPSGIDGFVRSYSLDDLRADASWGNLWDYVTSKHGPTEGADLEYADAIFHGRALVDHATELRPIVERDAHHWVRSDGSIDYSRVQWSMDDIVADIQAGREHAAELVPTDRPTLDGAVIVDDGIRLAAEDATSPYSCVPGVVAP